METKSSVKTDKLKRVILSEKEAIDVLLSGHSIDGIFLKDPEIVNEYNSNNAQHFEYDTAVKYPEDIPEEIFHQENINRWLIPDKYKSIDVLDYVLKKANTDEERKRVLEEYELYKQKDLVDVLRLTIYLVDTFRENNILWGVGRGSSVSSYILYLIGINRINPLKFNLSVDEFLR